MIRKLKDVISKARAKRRFKKANPTVKLHGNAKVSDSTLQGYNVLFSDVILYNSYLGKHSYIQKCSRVFIAEIGSYCSIAGGVFLGVPQHPLKMVTTHPAFYEENLPLLKTFCTKTVHEESNEKVTVGHDVWIGENALVMSGLNIGTGAVVGSGAVVTRDVPPYAIVGGVPAKLIRYRFDEETIRKLVDSKWWEQPEEWLEKHWESFGSPEDLFTALKENKK